MGLDKSRTIERTVDSIAGIYAVVIALAISQSIETLLKGASGGADLTFGSISTGVPSFVAFLFTLVPFWHGMNRHLDRSYLEKGVDAAQGALLYDFVIFFLEAGFLFAAAFSLRIGLATFYCLGALLGIDTLWAVTSHQIHSKGKASHALRWSGINVVAGFIALGVVLYPSDRRPWYLMIVAIGRSIFDYWRCWDFYFPNVCLDDSQGSVVPPVRDPH